MMTKYLKPATITKQYYYNKLIFYKIFFLYSLFTF